MYSRRQPNDQQLRDDLKEDILAELSRPPYDERAGAAYAREKEALHRELRRELTRQRAFAQASPQMASRRENLTRDIMEEARDLGLTPEELYARLSVPPNPSLRGRIKGLVTSREGKGFGWGVGITLAAVLLAPTARRWVRPAARKVVEEVIEAGDRIQRSMAQAKEDLEDLVAEARFHQFGNTSGETQNGNAPGPDTGEE